MVSSANSKRITGFVVGINESDLLHDSISSLSFCDQVVYVDLESADRSLEIAQALGAKCQTHQRVPYAEFVQSKVIPLLDSEWVVLLDPDERIDPILANFIHETINRLPPESLVGAIRVPTSFYFKGKRLRGTPWGHNNSKTIVFRRAAIDFTNKVHRGRGIKKGYEEISIPSFGENTIHHFWMQSWKQLFAKHLVYLKHEGRSQTSNDIKLNDIALKPIREFYISFFREKGYLDRGRGLALSLFWSWYQTSALLAVKRHQNDKRQR